jgi:NDP-sugar pyrophosphorylase family protein
LKSWIETSFQPNIDKIMAFGGYITTPTIIYKQEILTDFEYNLNGPHGRFEIRQGTRLLPEASLILPGAVFCSADIEIQEGVLIESGTMLKGPAVLGPGTEVRQGAYVRGSVLTGQNCIIGHATEAKNVLMLPEAKAGHFAYLGDSILGAEVNLGAGTKLANLRFDNKSVSIKVQGQSFSVSRRKLGAILGDRSQTGCNSVTNPGTFCGPDCRILPNSTAKSGYYPPSSIIGR